MKKEVQVLPDAESLARAAAGIFSAAAAEGVADRGRCAVALSGGRTPQALFRLLGREYGARLPWELVQLFWADERVVPPEDEQSNFRTVREELLARIALPPGNVHRIHGELPPTGAAAAYEAELRNYFGAKALPDFDLILLGIGTDGHTASLFPGAAVLKERHRWAVPLYNPATANWRVTLTLPVLNNASCVVFLVSGPEKAAIVEAILGRGKGGEYPAGMVKPAKGRLVWLLDNEAASALEAS